MDQAIQINSPKTAIIRCKKDHYFSQYSPLQCVDYRSKPFSCHVYLHVIACVNSDLYELSVCTISPSYHIQPMYSIRKATYASIGKTATGYRSAMDVAAATSGDKRRMVAIGTGDPQTVSAM